MPQPRGLFALALACSCRAPASAAAYTGPYFGQFLIDSVSSSVHEGLVAEVVWINGYRPDLPDGHFLEDDSYSRGLLGTLSTGFTVRSLTVQLPWASQEGVTVSRFNFYTGKALVVRIFGGARPGGGGDGVVLEAQIFPIDTLRLRPRRV